MKQQALKQDAFAAAMNRISAEADAEKVAEWKAERRSALLAKVRKVCFAVVLVALVGVAYLNRADLGQQWQRVIEKAGINSKPHDPLAQATGSIKELQETAAKRDKAIDDILRK